ncbi:MAG: septum site-determining protein MinC [Gammaproteobacteria bacterium]|nr:septum site-determining protein MinC [Gammaproteobacteria bacterium]
MTATAPALDNQSESFVLRNRMAGIAVLDVLSNNVSQLIIQLQQQLQLAPDLFRNAPVALHVTDEAQPLDIAQLCQQLKTLSLIPVAITSRSNNAEALAASAGLGVLELETSKPQTAATNPSTPKPQSSTKVVKQPVRSGQQVVSDGDLIVLGQVGAGAEVIAKGNIHIYGALRGRAFAGAQGDENCHIFCRQLDAELVAIAGVFKVSEELDESLRQRASHIQLQADQLAIAALG